MIWMNILVFSDPKGGGGGGGTKVGVKSESGGGMMENIAEAKKVVHVGVILDVNSPVGSVANACISMAISDFYGAHPNFRTRLSPHHRNSDDALAAAFTALELIDKEEVDAIIGPQTSKQARFVIDVGRKAQVPVISYSATSPSLSITQNPFFVRVALDDSTQAKVITAIVQAFEWHEVILIYEDTEYGSDLIPYLAYEFQQVDIRVSSRFSFSPNDSKLRILKKLNKVMAMQTRVIVVHMSSSFGSKLFFLAKDVAMISEGYVWIITDGLSRLLDPMGVKAFGSMQGVLGIRPYIPQSKGLKNFKRKWQSRIHSSSTKLNIFGYWAYDTIWALAKAVEMIPQESSSVNGENHHRNTSQFPVIKVSKRGKMILNGLLKTKFKGLSGDFSLVGGQLQSLTFEIINVIDNEEKVIGYWTLENGLTRKPDKAKMENQCPNMNLNHLYGQETRKTNPEDPYTKEFIITGFSHDVFEEALALLSFPVPRKLIPFPIGPNGGTYDELLSNVKNQTYDAAVGEITILANRSQHVDFTLPYLQSDVSMVVKSKDDERNNMWIFLKPLSWDLWLTTGVAFVCTGEKIINNLSKFVLIIWIFVVLILTQSYTASLASMLTVQRLEPTIIDIDELKMNGDFVGYETGSFVKDLLVKQLDFDESKLRDHGTAEEFDKALSKGSQNGGVGAIFGARHCVNLFLAKYCDKYMIVGPTYNTDGLGFAFPRGSPLVPVISRAILSVIENKSKMDAMEHKYFSHLKACQTTISSSSLGLYSFGGLFIITAVASVSSLIIYFTKFLQSHWTTIHTVHHDSSFWSKISELGKHFYDQSLYPLPATNSTLQSVEALHDVENEGVDTVVIVGNVSSSTL
ncbi:glutamate receptor 2.8 [Gossypium hirsutum]|uniref:Glutamate receptor n=1 Tax=Gossypium hirsutum TaxID=3635 RepID=A0A1U8IT91_GOSHI|nr:glutamate receptor 2.8-like [Gossypium hirsutum]